MNRQEWLAHRHKGIGSSDVPAIMGVSAYGKTPLSLWEEKILPNPPPEDDSNSFIKDQGNQAEVKIRSFFEFMKSKTYAPALAQMSEFDFMKSSLDGQSEDKEEIIEIKLLGDAEPTKFFTNAKEHGKVPEHYMPQVQHQLLVTGAKKCWFIAYKFNKDDIFLNEQMTLDNFVSIEVFPDPQYQAEMLEKCIKFWDLVQKKKPPPISDGDWKTLKNGAKWANKFKQKKLKFEKAEAELEEARQHLLELAEKEKHPRLEVSGVRIQQIQKLGNVDNKKVFKAYDDELENVNNELEQLYEETKTPENKRYKPKKPDQESYRGKGSSYFKCEVAKEKAISVEE